MFFWNAHALSMMPTDVGSLISVSSAFFETSLNIWKFTVHILLKPGLENFESKVNKEIKGEKDYFPEMK